MTGSELKHIFDKTGGHCHFCGDLLAFERHGKGGLKQKGLGWRKGWWEVSHVAHRARGGDHGPDNCLPACTGCNRLRWHRRGSYTRRTIFLGLIARVEIKRKTKVGRELERLVEDRKALNRGRRKSS